ncbi:MFS transporter [Macrococcoides caseolyticum]|uniref:MFS transporter n=1 Tax=Macrococcoides caseolyticum TaxID=69966 RepID=UPI000C337E34|nr:MFS transporter [Macrococcus caseolyticus]PKE30597.1 hypothetical protein CW668_10995 [Macrococcus caseolyticus]TDM13556.1 MFS transporter [Macrococcus caseolyticus]VUC66086.1 major facilitator family transporter [Macrococcus caseolyticus]
MYKKYRLKLLGAILFSQLGSSILGFMLMLSILFKTDSSLKFSYVVILSSVCSIIFSPFSGVIIDKYNKKIVMILSQVISILSLLLYLIYYLNIKEISVISISILIIFLNLSDSIFSTGILSSAVYIVNNEEELSKYNGLQQTIDSLCSLLGPIIAGILFSIASIDIFIIFEIAMEIIAVLFFLNINFRKNAIIEQDNEVENNKNSYSILNSVKYMLKKSKLSSLILGMFLMNFLLSALTIGLPVIMNEYFEKNTTALGIIQSSIPLGMIISGIVFVYIKINPSNLKITIISWLFCSILLIFIGLDLLLFRNNIFIFSVFLIIVNLFLGISLTAGKIPILTYSQKTINPHYQGRVFSILDVLIQVSIPLGILIYGFLFEFFNAINIFITTGIFVLILTTLTYRKISSI